MFIEFVNQGSSSTGGLNKHGFYTREEEGKASQLFSVPLSKNPMPKTTRRQILVILNGCEEVGSLLEGYLENKAISYVIINREVFHFRVFKRPSISSQ